MTKILVIDDDPITCQLIETVLQMENYQTESANYIDDQGIVAMLENSRPDMLILDLNLGSLDTLESAAAIRAHQQWQQLPILMTSGIDKRTDCLQAGASDFLLKPFNWQDITQRVNTICDGLTYQEG